MIPAETDIIVATHDHALVELLDRRLFAGPLTLHSPETGERFICIDDRHDTGDRLCVPEGQVKLIHLCATEESLEALICPREQPEEEMPKS